MDNEKAGNIQNQSESYFIDVEKYINSRLIEQMDYYHNAGAKYKKMFNRITIVNIIATGTIPLCSMFLDVWYYSKFIISFLGAITVVLNGILLLYQSEENHKDYRSVYEKLKTEQTLFMYKAGDYYKKDYEKCADLFITNCEDIMNIEHDKWYQKRIKLKLMD